MTEADRIRALERAGTITSDEAARLLAVLEDVESTEAELDAVERDAAVAPETLTPPTAPAADPTHAAAAASPAPNAPEAPEAAKAAEAPTSPTAAPSAAAPHAAPSNAASEPVPGVDRWLRVHMLGGELTVKTREDAEGIALEAGDDAVQMETEGNDVILRQFERGKSWIDRLVDGSVKADIVVVIPPRTGVDLDVKAGEVSIDRTPFLRADMLAGELSLRRADGIDVRMRAGELNATVRPTQGRHRVRITAGEANLRLLEDSDVTVNANVAMGELELSKDLGRSGSGLSTSRTATLGSGAATLDASASAGQLSIRTVKAPAEHASDDGAEVEHA